MDESRRRVGERPVRVAGGRQLAVATRPAIRDAATVILVSDRPDLHVLMLERTRRAVFGPGATVFPGGAVDPADARAALLARASSTSTTATASAEHGLAGGGLAFRIAALRECFEEAGHPARADAGERPARRARRRPRRGPRAAQRRHARVRRPARGARPRARAARAAAVLALAHPARCAASLQHVVLRRARARRRRRRARRQRARRVGLGPPARRARAVRRAARST